MQSKTGAQLSAILDGGTQQVSCNASNTKQSEPDTTFKIIAPEVGQDSYAFNCYLAKGGGGECLFTSLTVIVVFIAGIFQRVVMCGRYTAPAGSHLHPGRTATLGDKSFALRQIRSGRHGSLY